MPATSTPEEPPEVRLKDLRAGLPGVHVVGRVVTVSRKEITRKSDGRRTTVLNGLLSDGTATVRFTWWDPPAEGVEAGLVLRAVNAQVREFRQRPELSFGWTTRVVPASDLELPIVKSTDHPLLGVGSIDAHSEGFRIEVRVVDISQRSVTVGEERRAVHSGRFADGTGMIPFTSWVDFRLLRGAAVRIVGAYVRVFRGKPELTLDARSHIETLSPDSLPALPDAEPALRTLGDLEASGGGVDTHIEGLVVALVSPSGVVLRCPVCARVLQAGVCRLHGAQDGTPDLRARVAVDDGTGVATVHLSRVLTETLTGRALDQHLAALQRNPDASRIEDDLRERVLGRRFRVGGKSRRDDFGLVIFADSLVEVPPQPGTAIDLLAQRLAERPQ